MLETKYVVVMVLMMVLSHAAAYAVDSAYTTAYAKAENEFAKRIQEAHDAGHDLSPDERNAIRKELFADSEKAFTKETNSLYGRIHDIVVDVLKDLKGNDATLAGKKKDGDSKADDNSVAAKAPSSRSGKASSSATANRRGGTATSDSAISTGSAEGVTYLKPDRAPAANPNDHSFHVEGGGAATDSGGAQELKFTK